MRKVCRCCGKSLKAISTTGEIYIDFLHEADCYALKLGEREAMLTHVQDLLAARTKELEQAVSRLGAIRELADKGAYDKGWSLSCCQEILELCEDGTAAEEQRLSIPLVKQSNRTTEEYGTIMRHKDGCMEWRLTPEGACAGCRAVPERVDEGKRDMSNLSNSLLRDLIIRAHGMATGRYVQSDTVMRQRIGDMLEAAIQQDDTMRGFLGRGGPEAWRDPLATAEAGTRERIVSTCIYLACKPCQKCLWIGQDGLSGFTLYRGHPECMVAMSEFMREHILCDGNMEVMPEHACEDFEEHKWPKAAAATEQCPECGGEHPGEECIHVYLKRTATARRETITLTDNVIPLRGRELIETIETWLEQARKGEITAMAFAAVMDDGAVCEGWCGTLDNCTVTLYGAINILRDGYFHERIDHYSSRDNGPATT